MIESLSVGSHHRRIDLHAHVVPDAYRELLVAPDGSRPFAPSASLEELDANMVRYAIDAAAISVGPPGAYLGDQGRANELARAANESLATIVRGDPGRFAGVALLPLPDVDAALSELAYAFDHLDLDGVVLFTNIAGVYLGDSRWEPLYAELDRRGAYTFVHPTMPPYPPPLDEEHPVWLYEFPFDTTRALVHLIYSGTLERYPSIRLQFAHLGGTAPFIASRLGSLADREPERAGAARAQPSTSVASTTTPGCHRACRRLRRRARSRRCSRLCSGPTGRMRRCPTRATTPLRSWPRSRQRSEWPSTAATRWRSFPDWAEPASVVVRL
jgi:6-methylsalicylate decarboxylase